MKTIELDAALGGRAVQHREIQGHESDKFLSYFKPCIIPLEGGVASGFKKPEEEEFETRLYTCKGKRAVHLKQVSIFVQIFEIVVVLSSQEVLLSMSTYLFSWCRFLLLARR